MDTRVVRIVAGAALAVSGAVAGVQLAAAVSDPTERVVAHPGLPSLEDLGLGDMT